MSKQITKDRQEVFDILIDMQRQYLSELKNITNPDKETILIIKAKCIAIGQALTELGYEDIESEV